MPADLNDRSFLQQEPQFLTTPVSEWPITSQTRVTDIQEQSKKVFIANVDGRVTETLESRIDITRFSNINLLLNTTAWILRLYHDYKANNNKLNENFITIQERHCFLTFWIKHAQSDIDIKSVEFMIILPRIKDEIIVVGGRTEK